MVDEWQCNIINTQRKHKIVMEKEWGKKRKLEIGEKCVYSLFAFSAL
jgi:hypothetical protein